MSAIMKKGRLQQVPLRFTLYDVKQNKTKQCYYILYKPLLIKRKGGYVSESSPIYSTLFKYGYRKVINFNKIDLPLYLNIRLLFRVLISIELFDCW